MVIHVGERHNKGAIHRFTIRIQDLALGRNLDRLDGRLVGELLADHRPGRGDGPLLGFVGGMDIPLIHKFEAGYRAGVRQVCPDCEVIAQYAGVTPDAFKNPGKGKELALSQYQSGVNVIFHASGSTGQGVFEAARVMNKLAIGVDADQYAEAPGHVLTSMVKGVNAAVFDAIQRVQSKTFKGGIYSFGLKENGVGYIYDEHNKSLIPDSVYARVEQLKQEIIAGRIKVPSTR